MLLVNLGRLAVAVSGWAESLDINPIISNRDGLAAVDVSVVARPLTTNEEKSR